MTRWTKGEPYPENWPEWLKEADIEWCDVGIDSNGYVTWREGVWNSGGWETGTWVTGTWHRGTWLNGTWWGGVWHNGIWLNGTRYNGAWNSGVWENGTWRNGTWRSGTWRSGTWLNGIWESGHQSKPRFGWSLGANGTVFGFDGEHWASKTAEEWQPLLEGMPHDKVIEFKALLYWNSMRRTPASKTASTLWDHLQNP